MVVLLLPGPSCRLPFESHASPRASLTQERALVAVVRQRSSVGAEDAGGASSLAPSWKEAAAGAGAAAGLFAPAGEADRYEETRPLLTRATFGGLGGSSVSRMCRIFCSCPVFCASENASLLFSERTILCNAAFMTSIGCEQMNFIHC